MKKAWEPDELVVKPNTTNGDLFMVFYWEAPELVALYFTAMMVARYYLNVKDQVGFREFIEQQVELYYLDKALFAVFSMFAHNPKAFFSFLSGFI